MEMAHLKILPLGVVFASAAVPSTRWLYLSPSARCVRRMEVDGETGMASCLKLAGRRRGRPGPARVRRAGNEDVSSNFVRHARSGLHLSHGARAGRGRFSCKDFASRNARSCTVCCACVPNSFLVRQSAGLSNFVRYFCGKIILPFYTSRVLLPSS
jgi:hypothetical protein